MRRWGRGGGGGGGPQGGGGGRRREEHVISVLSLLRSQYDADVSLMYRMLVETE